MRLLCLFLTVCFLQVSARTEAQQVSYSVEKGSLKEAFTALEKQTGMVFFFSSGDLAKAKPVTVTIKKMTIEKALEALLKDQPLQYQITGNTVFIKAKSNVPAANSIAVSSMSPPPTITGRLKNDKGEPLAGVNISVKGGKVVGVTGSNGEFTLTNIADDATLVFSAVTIETIEIKVNGKTSIELVAKIKVNELGDVTITAINTGYQQIPKERATGSFTVVNNAELNRRVSSNVIARLEGIASGLAFYRNAKTDQPTLNIRGRSTIFANVTPLIILDNFPYDGDINSINPNDIENITLLKDAAAASIYGVRAANGVIVITSKKGVANQTRIQYNSAVTLTRKTDLDYFPRLSTADFIESEKEFFSRGWYAGQEVSTSKTPLTPVVEILIKKRDGLLTAAAADQAIAALAGNDVTKEYEQRFLQTGVLVQNSLSLSGGSDKSRYYLSLGVDNDQSTFTRNYNNRYTVNASNVFTPFNRFEITTSLVYTYTKSAANNPGINDFISAAGRKYYPYARLADADGKPLAVTFGFRDNYKTQREALGSPDLQYRPVDELNLANNITGQYYTRFNGGVKYGITRDLSVAAQYQYEKQLRKNDNLMPQESYTVRTLINQYYNPTGTVKYPVPLGAIYDMSNTELESHLGRLQLNYNKSWNKHAVSALAGFEARQLYTGSNQNRLYGYDPGTLVSQPVDYTTRFATVPLGSLVAVTNPRTITSITDRFLSYYANGSYTYDRRYTFSLSGRLDNTNYFGIETNNRAVPLWSAGAKWNIINEKFFHASWLDQLSLRATYGYNGNINKDLTAYTTVRYATDPFTQAANATVVNPPNPTLRWEKIGMMNIGVDFALKKVLSGSIEYFVKNGVDLIGDAAMDPTTGISSFRGNLSSIKGQGMDVTLNAKWIDRRFKWTTGLLFSYATDKVYDYTRVISPGAVIQQGSGDASTLAPQIGRPVLSFYSYRFGGLDPATGDPLGYVAGKTTNNYADIISKTTIADLVYHGPVNPPVFGSLRNDFSYDNFSLSFNLTYKLGHYFRRASVDYGYMLNFWYINNDYAQRWKKPGDEATTTVPSIPTTLPAIANARDASFYANSEVLVEKADHIRLQDIALSYDFNMSGKLSNVFKRLRVYGYVNNVGIIWRSNKYGIDPDAIPNSDTRFLPQSTSFSLGIKAEF